MRQERNGNADLIRVIAMLFVIGIHIQVNPFEGSAFGYCLMANLFWSCNGLFFALSGMFNLGKDLKDREAVLDFYVRRLITIVLPFAVFTLLMYARDVLAGDLSLGIRVLYDQVLEANGDTHLWFLYTLIPFILSTPILSRAFHHMEDGELKLLFILAMAWNFLEAYLVADMGLSFPFANWALSGMMIYYFGGYYISRTAKPKDYKKIFLWGAVGFAVTQIGMVYFEEYYIVSAAFEPAFALYVLAFFVFLLRVVRVPGWAAKPLAFLAKHSFLEYMIHWHMIQVFQELVDLEAWSSTPRFLAILAGTFVLSLSAAFLLNELLIFPVQKALLKCWKQYREKGLRTPE